MMLAILALTLMAGEAPTLEEVIAFGRGNRARIENVRTPFDATPTGGAVRHYHGGRA